MFNSPLRVIFIMFLFFVNCERTVLFSVKLDLDPSPPLYPPDFTIQLIDLPKQNFGKSISKDVLCR